MKARTRMIDVVVWGRRPPPIGGVTRSVEAMVQGLLTRGLTVEAIDLHKPEFKQLIWVLSSTRGVSIYHISGPSSLIRFLPIIALDRRRKALFLHAAEGGTTRAVHFPWTFQRMASRFSKIWVTNAMLAAHVRREIGADVSVASPFSGTVQEFSKPRADHVGKLSCVTFMHNGHKLYNAQLAAASVHRLRQMGVDASLEIVSYGSSPRAGAWNAVAELASRAPWLSVTANTGGDGAEGFLREADVLLRLTTTDGDSMVLREALSWGLRVVASSKVPRPRGVELADLSVESVSDVIMNGGKVSEGDGLGESILDEFLNWRNRP